jgi:hypothetical protein
MKKLILLAMIVACKKETVSPVTTVSAPVVIHTAYSGSQDTIKKGSAIQLQLKPDSTSFGVTYAWSPATGLSCTTCPNPLASPTATVTYTITSMDPKRYSHIDSIKIVVN